LLIRLLITNLKCHIRFNVTPLSNKICATRKSQIDRQTHLFRVANIANKWCWIGSIWLNSISITCLILNNVDIVNNSLRSILNTQYIYQSLVRRLTVSVLTGNRRSVSCIQHLRWTAWLTPSLLLNGMFIEFSNL
jgi:hypothetical protein